MKDPQPMKSIPKKKPNGHYLVDWGQGQGMEEVEVEDGFVITENGAAFNLDFFNPEDWIGPMGGL